MNSTKQLWALIKFQIVSNPYLWIIAGLFGIPISASYFMVDPAWSNFILSMPQPGLPNFIVLLLGICVIAPEKLHLGGWNIGSEFLLTRAVDRAVLYRSKAVLLYVMATIFPLISLGVSLINPNITLIEPKWIQTEILSHFPGSTPEPAFAGDRLPPILVPQGNVIIEEWHLWLILIEIVGIQALVLVSYLLPLPVRLMVIWWPGFLIFFGPFLPHTYYASVFFVFVTRQALFWVITGALIILSQPLFERRFANLEA